MAVYWVTGKMRNGKGLFCSMMAKQFYCRGYRIAANYPMDTELMHAGSNNPLTVLPMHPRPQDLWELGRGCDENEKEQFGALFLDEVGTWLNSASNSKEYLEYYKWFVQSGKLGWDVYIQVQDESAVDTKIFKSTGELIVRCRRLDRIRIPVVSDILEICFPDKFGDTGKRKGLLPSLISSKIYIGVPKANSRPNESRIFYAPSFYGIHPTNLVFDDGKELIGTGEGKRVCDMRAVYSLLPGKTLRQFSRIRQRMNKGVVMPENVTQPEADLLPEELKQKRKGRRKKLITGVFLVLFFWFWGRIALNLFTDDADEIPAPASRTEAPVSAPAQVSVAPIAAPVVLPVSQVWRLAGYMRDASGQASFIVRNSSNVTRFVRSEQPYNGLLTALELDGEHVTFYSGAGNNPASSSPANNNGMGSLVTLATP